MAYRILPEQYSEPYNAPTIASSQSQQIDGILLELPHFNSITLLRQLKEQMGDCGPPIVVIANGNTESAIQAFKNGAVDYLVRDQITPDELRLAMRSAIENAELRRKLQHSQEQFQTSVENMLDCFGIFSAIRHETGQIVDFRIDYLNAAACKNNQMPKAMQIGQGLCELFPAHHESGLFDEYCRLVETGEPLIKDSLVYDDTFGDRQLVRAFDIRATKLNDGFVASWRDVTDHRQLELELSQTVAALQASQQRHRDLAEAMPQIVWTAEATGAVNYWNQRWYEYTGLSEAESFGLAGVSAVHPDDRDCTLMQWGQAIANGASFEIEYQIQSRDGEYRWFISRAIPTRDSRGQITGWIGTVTDIDHQKRLEAKLLNEIENHRHTEQDLRRGEERLKLAQLAANAGHWSWQIGTNKVFWSPEYYALYGIDPAIPPSYENWLASILEIDRERADRAVRAALANNQSEVAIEYRVHHPIWGVRWLLAKGQTDFNAAGQPEGMIGFTFDITDRKQAEIALQQNQERLDLAMEAAKMGSWDWDIQTGQVNWSTNLEHLFGMASGSFNGRYKTVTAMMHPDDLPWVQQAIHRAIHEREDYNIEFRFIKPDGTVRWALGLGRVFYDAVGNPAAMTGVDMDISDRKQSEAALRTSEARFRDMADNAPVMIWVTDATGKCTYLSKSWYEFTGQTEATGLGLGWLDAVHPEDYEPAKEIFLRANEQREAFRLEYRLCRQDGAYRWAIDAASPWFGENGEFKGYIGSVIDISDRKQAEAALTANEARLRGFVDANVVGIIYGDIYGNIHEANDELLRIVGYTREDLQAGSLRWVNITPLEYLPLDEQGIAEARANGACTPYEKEYVRKDGSRVSVLIGYSLVGEAREESVVFVLDLSDRKQAEAALRESENRLRLALESTKLGTWDFNPITAVLQWDDQCKAMFGLSPEAVVNYDVFLAGLHPEDRDRTHQVVLRSFNPESGGEYDIEYRTIGLEDGRERWVAAKGKTFFNLARVPIRFIGTVLNITEKKRAEAEREQLLRREQAARAEAERANRLKDEFLAVLSHELRAPLNPILGWTQLLQIRKFDEKQTAQALATIERNAKLQTQLIDDLLDVAKILRGKLSLSMSSVNLSSVVEAAIETVKAAAVAKSISLHAVLPNVGQVSGDAARLQQIVWNLLSNAIKFTPDGGQVDIRMKQVGNHAEITVSDTGRGINPDFLPHIFESFRQEDASITRKYGGLGLGLAIVRQLVEAQDGTITASSFGEGLGAAFTVQLPLLNLEPERSQPAELPQQEHDLTSIRVLAVDDDPDARDLLTVLLSQYGADVLAVASAEEVMTNLESFQPDVLVSDIGMPEVDGYTLIQQVRALPAAKGGLIPAIALTAYARDDDYQQSLSSGYQWHVTKPLEPERLIRAVVALAPSKL
ncbi:PAS domain S-box protein [Phormidium tenue FACHB-886]|nr:PAS domain S-box protein [Phormidium tenue FACHB-886]